MFETLGYTGVIDRESQSLLAKMGKLTKKSNWFKRLSLCASKYKSPSGYTSIKQVIWTLANHYSLFFYSPSQVLNQKDFYVKNLIVSAQIIEKLFSDSFTPYCLSSTLFDAFLHSNLPEKLYKFDLPLQNGIILFPKPIYNPDGLAFNWVAFNCIKNQKDQFLPNKHLNVKVTNSYDDPIRFSWYAIAESKSALTDPMFYTHHVGINFNGGELKIGKPVAIDFPSNVNMETENEFCDRISGIVLQTLFYLQLKQIKPPSVNKRGAVFDIPLLGADYKIKRETSLNDGGSSSGNGSHASPIPHWRRGHYRHQPYGSRENPEYRLIWIHPILVNG